MACSAQRLPDLAIPEHYRVNLAPNFGANTFHGDVAIDVKVSHPTTEIVLNSVELELHEASIESRGIAQKAKVTLDAAKEVASLRVVQPIAAGPAVVRIRFSGKLNRELRGLYLGKLEDGRKYAVTQFEATDARRAFPCFDEPAFKARFDLTVTARQDDVAISNGKLLSDVPGPGPGQHTVRFAQTAKMSSYLVALAVGNFEWVEGSADGVPIRVYTAPGKKEMGRFALEQAEQSVRYFNRYFGIPYPFEKLDLIGLPDFSAGAMENTAAITFRERDLLVDPQHSAVETEKNVAETIAHEIAHMWFGDLVTMQWWDDLWLNEGFATWMETKAVATWKPEWQLDLDEALTANYTLESDSLANTHPIHQPVDTPEQINELFDDISYGKAGAVLRMLENYLGPDTFQAGVRSYLRKHAYGNATSQDFWQALTEASKQPVDQIMPTFVQQAGAPIVSVATRCQGGKTEVELSQQRFFEDRALFRAGDSELWQVPVCMKQAGQSGKGTCFLLKQRSAIATLPGCTPWVMTNSPSTGYYISSYEPAALREMSRDLEAEMTPAERVRLLGDLWKSVRVGRQPMSDFLDLAGGLQNEQSSAVVSQLTDTIQFMSDNLVDPSGRANFQAWVEHLLRPSADELGWKSPAGESGDRQAMRAQAQFTLGYAAGAPDVLREAAKLANTALADPKSVDPALTEAVLNLAAMHGDAALYDRVYARMKKAASPEEYRIYIHTLAAFGDPKLLARTLGLALSPEVRGQDSPRLISAVMENPAGRRLAWSFVEAHWEEIETTAGGFNSSSIVEATGSFCDSGLRDDVKQFFSTHKAPSSDRALRQSIERMNNCVAMREQSAEHLNSWLSREAGAAGK